MSDPELVPADNASTRADSAEPLEPEPEADAPVAKEGTLQPDAANAELVPASDTDHDSNSDEATAGTRSQAPGTSASADNLNAEQLIVKVEPTLESTPAPPLATDPPHLPPTDDASEGPSGDAVPSADDDNKAVGDGDNGIANGDDNENNNDSNGGTDVKDVGDGDGDGDDDDDDDDDEGPPPLLTKDEVDNGDVAYDDDLDEGDDDGFDDEPPALAERGATVDGAIQQDGGDEEYDGETFPWDDRGEGGDDLDDSDDDAPPALVHRASIDMDDESAWATQVVAGAIVAHVVDANDTANPPSGMINIDDLMAVLTQPAFGLQLSEYAAETVRHSIMNGGEQWVVPGDVFVRYIALAEPLVFMIREAHASAEDVAPGWSDWVFLNRGAGHGRIWWNKRSGECTRRDDGNPEPAAAVLWALHRSVAEGELHDPYVDDGARGQKQSDKEASLDALNIELEALKTKLQEAADARAAKHAEAQAVKDQIAAAKAEQVAVTAARSKLREELAAVNAANKATLDATAGRNPHQVPAIQPLANDQERLMGALLAVAEQRARCGNERAKVAAIIADQATQGAKDLRDVDAQVSELDATILNGSDELFREKRDMREVHLDDAARRSMREINGEIFARSQPLLAELTAMDEELATAKDQIRDLCLENYNIKLWLAKRVEAGITPAELHSRCAAEERAHFATKARLEQAHFDLQRTEEATADARAFVERAAVTYQQSIALHTSVEQLAAGADAGSGDDDYGKPLPGIYRLLPSPTKRQSAMATYGRGSPTDVRQGGGRGGGGDGGTRGAQSSTFLFAAHQHAKLRRGNSENGMGSAPSRINQLGTMRMPDSADRSVGDGSGGSGSRGGDRNSHAKHVDFAGKYDISLSESDSDSDDGRLASASSHQKAASSRRASEKKGGRRSPTADRNQLRSRPSLSELANESQVDRAIAEDGIWPQWFQPPK